jgi:hypothetical protein
MQISPEAGGSQNVSIRLQNYMVAQTEQHSMNKTATNV